MKPQGIDGLVDGSSRGLFCVISQSASVGLKRSLRLEKVSKIHHSHHKRALIHHSADHRYIESVKVFLGLVDE